jgi:hypothetical protein
MRADLSPPDSRHPDDFVFWSEAQKLDKCVLDAVTSNDVNACFCQQANGGCTGPRQLLPWKREGASVAVSLRDLKMMPPGLALSFALEAELVRPRYRIDAIFGDPQPSPRKQCVKPAASLVVEYLDERSLARGAAAAAVFFNI